MVRDWAIAVISVTRDMCRTGSDQYRSRLVTCCQNAMERIPSRQVDLTTCPRDPDHAEQGSVNLFFEAGTS